MKKLFGVAAVCAALCLASCEHYELAASDNGQQQTDEVTKRFTFTVKAILTILSSVMVVARVPTPT